MDDDDFDGGIAGKWLAVAPGTDASAAPAATGREQASTSSSSPNSKAASNSSSATRSPKSRAQPQPAQIAQALASGGDGLTKALDAIPLEQLQEIESRVARQLEQIRAALARRSSSSTRAPATEERRAAQRKDAKVHETCSLPGRQAAASAARPKPGKHAHGSDPAMQSTADDDDELDAAGAIAGRWLEVPAGASLDGSNSSGIAMSAQSALGTAVTPASAEAAERRPAGSPPARRPRSTDAGADLD